MPGFRFWHLMNPNRIMDLIERFPEFRGLYEDVYEMCRNIEGVMNMYSKELAELDRNTVQYMIEEQEKVIKEQKEQLDKKDSLLIRQAEENCLIKKRGLKDCRKRNDIPCL